MSSTKHGIKKQLDRVGLLKPLYWVNQQVRTLRVQRLSRQQAQEIQEFSDGLPIPPARLLVAIGGATSTAAYLQGGKTIATEIERALASHGAPLQSMSSILDFGCGSGRVIRNFRHLPPSAKLSGCDYNEALVSWCRANLPFAAFDPNQLEPPLPYSESAFDLVYAYSVFTHLSENLQFRWLGELRRILKPGGRLLFTVQAAAAASVLDSDELDRFNRGELVVRYGGASGSNLCAAFHPFRTSNGPWPRAGRSLTLSSQSPGSDSF